MLLLLRSLFALTLIATVSGCSTLQVRIDPRSDAVKTRSVLRTVADPVAPSNAAQWLAYSQNRKLTEAQRLGALVEAARFAANGASVDGSADQVIYNTAVRGVVAILRKHDFQDAALAGSTFNKLEIVRTGEPNTVDPTLAKSVYSARSVRIGGIHSRSIQDGPGEPYVGSFAGGSSFLQAQPGIPRIGMAIPLTAYLTFDGPVSRLAFQNTLDSNRAQIAGKPVTLAADFSAPIATLLSKGVNRSLDVAALIFTDRNMDNAQLWQIQPYDPNKIPVIFVHGLVSRPEAWTQATNRLMADPEIRAKYQFWFFQYPTGLPVWETAAKLRFEMKRFFDAFDPDGKNPTLRKTVVIGHSMGGLVASILIRRGGRDLWSQLSDEDFDTLPLRPDLRAIADNTINFVPHENVERVIFVATPHRGSPVALRPFANFAANLIRLPFSPLTSERSVILDALRYDVRSLFSAPANSIRFLRANSPLLEVILKLPRSQNVTYHSIIGDRDRGDTPDSSDGVVPYWSSTLPGAVSEKIVPSGHGANENAEGIEEMRRILTAAIQER